MSPMPRCLWLRRCRDDGTGRLLPPGRTRKMTKPFVGSGRQSGSIARRLYLPSAGQDALLRRGPFSGASRPPRGAKQAEGDGGRQKPASLAGC
jgi:hypothetical protein